MDERERAQFDLRLTAPPGWPRSTRRTNSDGVPFDRANSPSVLAALGVTPEALKAARG